MDWVCLISDKTYNFYYIHKYSAIINENITICGV